MKPERKILSSKSSWSTKREVRAADMEQGKEGTNQAQSSFITGVLSVLSTNFHEYISTMT